MTRAFATELAKYGITCNVICPGYFETELTKPVLDTLEFQEYMNGTVQMQRYDCEGELNVCVISPIDGGYSSV